ncbi:MAG: AtpZ/AtpI family protein [Gemmatimonadetes bacterium]|nr:AtpZ/AtpI family protein [Gemmatimonadota bacterium]
MAAGYALLAKNFTKFYLSARMVDSRRNRGFGDGTQYLAAAMRFAGAVVMFLFAGLALDRWLKTTPLLTLVGALGGAVLGFLSVYREYKADPDHKAAMRSWSDKRRDSDSR